MSKDDYLILDHKKIIFFTYSNIMISIVLMWAYLVNREFLQYHFRYGKR